MTCSRSSAGSTTRTSGPYEASSSAKTCTSTYGTRMPWSAGVARRLRRSAASVPGFTSSSAALRCGDLLEPGEGALARAVAQRGVEGLAGDLDGADDPRQQERAIRARRRDRCRRRATAPRSRRARAAACRRMRGRVLARLEVGEGHDPRLLDRLLQRRERRVAKADARRVADDRLVDRRCRARGSCAARCARHPTSSSRSTRRRRDSAAPARRG